MELALGETAQRRRLLTSVPWHMLLLSAALSALGVWNLASAGRAAPSPVWQSQILWTVLGLAAAVAICVFDYKWVMQIAWPLYGVVVALLVIVLVKGRVIMGAQRWIEIGRFNLQPSELAKLAVIIVLAKYFHDDDRRVGGYELHQLWLPLLLLFVPVGLIMKEPDLGTSIIVMAIGATSILFARVRWRALAVVGVLALAGGVVVWRDLNLEPGEKGWLLRKAYQKKRVTTFLNPDVDALGAAYHANQSLIAVGSGRFAGKGWAKGTQTQLSFLPAQHTDFAFSVWAEEQGFMGAVGAILLYLALVASILLVAGEARDKFGAFLCAGVAGMFFWHTFINIGMVTNLMPVVGVPAPLLSYGGSAVVTMLVGLGIVANVAIRRHSHGAQAR